MGDLAATTVLCHHHQEYVQWLLSLSFSSKVPDSPITALILQERLETQSLREKDREGGAEAQTCTTTWPPAFAFPPPAAGSLATVELQLQLPDATPVRRQGISARLLVGTASVGVVPARQGSPFCPSLDSALSDRYGAGGLL